MQSVLKDGTVLDGSLIASFCIMTGKRCLEGFLLCVGHFMQITFWREVKERHLKVLLLCLFIEHVLGHLQNPCVPVVLTTNLLPNLHSLQWILTLTFVLGTSRALPFLAVAWTREHVFSMHVFLTKMLDLAGGVYHGKVKFPPEYPFKPPGIRFTFP